MKSKQSQEHDEFYDCYGLEAKIELRSQQARMVKVLSIVVSKESNGIYIQFGPKWALSRL